MKKIRSKKELQQLVANIRKDFEEYAVNEVGFQIEQAYESCIQKFYEDYPGNGKNIVEAEMLEDDLRIDGMNVSFSIIFEKSTDPFIKSVLKSKSKDKE